jgi:hypothetical protein
VAALDTAEEIGVVACGRGWNDRVALVVGDIEMQGLEVRGVKRLERLEWERGFH